MENIELKEDEEIVELESSYIALEIPSSTLEVEITAKVWLDGEMKEARRKMSFDEVREAIKEAEIGYIPSDATFTLTEKGKELFEDVKNGKIEWCDVCT